MLQINSLNLWPDLLTQLGLMIFFYQFFQPKYKIAIKKNLKELDVWVWWPNVPGHKKQPAHLDLFVFSLS
jgi:hypothetical protein